MEQPIYWERLKEYRCPLGGCNASLEAIGGLHLCTRKECTFRITDWKLSKITVQRKRKLEPPEFIKELRRQEELNRLIGKPTQSETDLRY